MNGTFERVASVPGAFAHLVAERLSAPREGGFSLFVSGGSTAQECYERLAALTGPGTNVVDWSTVDVYWGDERCVPLDHPDSNHRMVTEALIEVIGPVGSDHPMYRSGSSEEAAASYQDQVSALGPLDLVHLGLGPDGHTASLFSDSTALAIEDPTVLVVANRDPNANNPHDRITLTLPGIARARLVVITVSGASKHGALERMIAGADLPGARVDAGEVVWLVDDAAAGDLDLPS
jgi:6-phosphogluconolactonase